MRYSLLPWVYLIQGGLRRLQNNCLRNWHGSRHQSHAQGLERQHFGGLSAKHRHDWSLGFWIRRSFWLLGKLRSSSGAWGVCWFGVCTFGRRRLRRDRLGSSQFCLLRRQHIDLFHIRQSTSSPLLRNQRAERPLQTRHVVNSLGEDGSRGHFQQR